MTHDPAAGRKSTGSADTVEVERLGGFAGFGGPGARLRSHGQLQPAALPQAQRHAVEQWLAQPPAPQPARRGAADEFRYRITVHRAGTAVVLGEWNECDVPEALRDCVRDELA